ncbi:MAG TPA: pseudouridine-5'-phosphate glycosidase [Paracoccaceae bacterium]|nr:pseudouridine-5'-phosphate glycosidase [Paracoccaceae bacterium]
MRLDDVPAMSEAVADALAEGRPVVALESTILAHGLPAPRNLEVAAALEDVVRAGGAVPATIAVLDGRLRVGLDAAALERLAAGGVAKLSRADLAAALATGGDGATTVAATMIAARAAGIEVFATGGIGGVHRGAEATWDVSADLRELAETPVTVVAAGAKAILDLPRTLEVLETLGVPVIGWRTDAFPAFWSRESGLPCPLRMETAAEVARAHRMRAALGLPGGQLLAVPIPEAAEVPRAEIEAAVADALAAAARDGVTGKAVTPFLLSRIVEATGGRSLEANVALVLNDAAVATEVAVALAETR